MKLNNNHLSTIAGASLILTLTGFLSKGIGFIREIIYANNFGLSKDFDLFLASSAIPIVVNTAIIYLCQHYFIPAFNKIKKEVSSNYKSLSAIDEFFSFTFWWFLFGGLCIAVLLFAFSEIIIGYYLSGAGSVMQHNAILVFQLFLITIPINAGMAVVTAYMQANFKFIYPAVSQIILNIIVIVMILLFTDILKINVLPLSFVFAFLISFILLINPVKNKLKFYKKTIFNSSYILSDINILVSLIFIEGLSLSYIIIDRYFIGKIPEGGLAALNYALVIYSLPVSLFSIPLITTMFSKFSQSSVTTPENLANELKNSVGINIFIMIPVTFILFFWGDIFLQLFYERGKFTSSDTILTHSVLQNYSISLVFYSSYLIIVKLLYGINKYRIVFVISIIAFFLKIILNFLLIDILRQNGLALSTSFIYIFLFFIGFYLGINQINMKEKRFYLFFIPFFLLNGIISYLIVSLLLNIVKASMFISEISGLFIFVGVYTLNSFLVKDTSFNIIRKTTGNIFK